MSENETETPKKKGAASFNVTFPTFPPAINYFRYALAMLFVVLKLHVFGAPTAVIEWSWWMVFLPVYALEAGIFALLMVLGVLAVALLIVGGFFYVLWKGASWAYVSLRDRNKPKSLRRSTEPRFAELVKMLQDEQKRPVK